MNDSRTLASAGDPRPDAFTLLVAVGNPAHVEQLMRTAADVARANDGSIHVVSVVAKDYDSPFGVFDDETILHEFAHESSAVLDAAIDAGDDLDVPVSGAVVVDRSVSRGLLKAAKATDVDAMLVGWTGPAWRPRAVLGTTVDVLIERATVDLYVERIGATADGVDAVLVPIAGGPHQAIAVRAGEAIARANSAGLSLLTVKPPSKDESEPDERPIGDATSSDRHLADARDALVDEHSSRVAVRAIEGSDVVDTILAAARDHDVIVMGATRGGPLRARLVGSIPRAVTDRSDRTVLLARRWTGRSRPSRLLGRLRRR